MSVARVQKLEWPEEEALMSAPVKKRLLTIDEYRRMGEAGIFHEDDRVELIRGEIYEMSPIGSRHTGCVRQLNQILNRRVGSHGIVDVQNPVCLEQQQSEPQPDLAVLRHRNDFYRSATPGPGDTILVIEVSDSSLAYDRKVKIPLYAESGIPEAWIADLEGETVIVYRQPSPEGYREMRTFGRGETVCAEALPELSVSVNEILGEQ
ncbi:MAG TPA: Uma2 family endonuclease [Thermoanaerobaculia bacterium]|nr:Uma2 family endonuclease [Thermoanaerobaculia bacterium]